MKKIVLVAVLVLLIAIGGGVYYLLSNLDAIVKSALETYGSQATGTVVRVESVKIGLKDGSGAIHGVTVANPHGFSAPQVFSLGEISTRIDLKSISADVLVIEQVSVLVPEIFFELNAAGQNNLDVLKQRLASGAAGASSSPAAKQDAGKEPKLIIRKLLFADGSIHAKVVPLDRDYELKLPRIELADLGGKDGATPTRIAEQVLKVLSDRALAEVKKRGLDQYKEKLEGEVNKRLETEKQKITDRLNEQVGDKLKGLFK